MNKITQPLQSTRRRTLLALAALSLPTLTQAQFKALPPVTVYKTEFCGCCKDWIAHMQNAGFQVEARNVPDTAPWRKQLGIPERHASCHTASVGGYAIEGHVPAADIKRLLAEKPAAVGLAVPGMPIGSPGMEVGNKKDPYDVLLVANNGQASVYRSYR